MKNVSAQMAAVLLPVLALVGWAGMADAQLPATIGPYLQHPAPNGMTVCYLVQGTGAVEVLYSAGQPERACAAVATAVPGTPWTVWKARIDGLQPGMACTYRIRLRGGEGVAAESAATFTTLDPASPETRLIALNDLHNNIATLAALMKRVKPEDFNLSLLLGDCWADPSPANGAEVVFRTLDAYVRLLDAAHKPMLLVRGNHETRGGFSGRMALLFDIPGLDASAKADDQRWPFAFRAGPVHFLAMDTGEDDDFGTPTNSYKRPIFWQEYRKQQVPWLTNALAVAASSGAPWKVFLSHIPLYNPAGWCSVPARTYWEPYLRDAGLAAMLAGHDHAWKMVPGGQPVGGATPPCPVLIGGGPSLKEGTVMLLEANAGSLRVRLANAEGQPLTGIETRK